jgi:hypothetical protein
MDINTNLHNPLQGSTGGTGRTGPEHDLQSTPFIADDVNIGGEPPRTLKKCDPSLFTSAASFEAGHVSALGHAAAASMVASPVSVPLHDMLEKLSGKNVEFFKKRGFYIPFLMKKFKKLSADEAAQIIEKGNEKERGRLKAVVDGKSTIDRFTEEDARELIVFKGLDPSVRLPHHDLAEFLKEVDAAKSELLSPEGAVMGGFGAYRSLTSKDSPGEVMVRHCGIDVMTITSSSLDDVKPLRKDYGRTMEIAKKLDYNAHLVSLARIHSEGFSAEEKAELLKKLRDHSRDSKDSEKTRAHVADDFELIMRKAGGNSEAKELCNLYVRMLDSIQSNYWREDYPRGLDFIAARLKDHPDEFEAFRLLLARNIGIDTARAIFDSLPQPVAAGAYKDAAAHFVNNERDSSLYWDPEKAGIAMKPVEGLSLGERVDTINGIYKHSRNYNKSEKNWPTTSGDYEALLGKAKDGREAQALSKLYVQMLDSIGSNYWREDYPRGLDFIAARLKDHPDEFEAFRSLLARNIGIDTAVAIFDGLPQPASAGAYKDAAAHFVNNERDSGLYWDPEKVALAIKPVEGLSVGERIDTINGIYKHSRNYNKSEKNWPTTRDDYQALLGKAKDGKEALALSGLYVQMLDSIGSNYWREDYPRGLEFIAARLKDHPDEFEAFRSLLSRGIGIDTARAIFDNLAQPPVDGAYKEAASLFVNNQSESSLYWDPDKVALAMKPVEGLSLGDRIDTLRRIYYHSRNYNNSDKNWPTTRNDYEALLGRAHDGKEALTLSKLYVQMLDAMQSQYWREDYPRGLDFIAMRLKDHPDEFRAFAALVSRGISIDTARAIFDNLAQPPDDGAYKEAAALFMNNQNDSSLYWDPDKAALAMKPVEGLSLADRIGTIRGIYVHSRNYNNSDKNWPTTRNDYEAILERAHDGKEAATLSKLYVQMLDAIKLQYWQENYPRGLDFIAMRLKDHPDEFEAFRERLSRGISIDTARAVFDSLPQPPPPGAFKEAVALFENNENNSSLYWDPEKAALAMKPVEGLPLRERIDFLRAVYTHSGDSSNSDNTWKNARGDYEFALGFGGDHGHHARSYREMQDAIQSRYWQKSYRDCFRIMEEQIKDDKSLRGAFLDLLKCTRSSDETAAMFRMVEKPVGNEDFPTRLRAAQKLRGENLQKFYDLASRNIPDGETIEDSASVLAALRALKEGRKLSEYAALFPRVQDMKGELRGAVAADFIRYASFDTPDPLLKILALVGKGSFSETVEKRRDLFMSHFKTIYEENRNSFPEAVKDFAVMEGVLNPGESLKNAADCFAMLSHAIGTLDEAKGGKAPALARDTLEFFGRELKKGSLGSDTLADVVQAFVQELLLAKNVESARISVVYKHNKPENGEVDIDDNVVVIGGIKLDVKKHGARDGE